MTYGLKYVKLNKSKELILALDPNISLQLTPNKPLDLPAMITAGNQVLDQPRIAAQAADAARTFAFKQFAGLHANDWMKADPSNPNGPKMVDYPIMMAKAQDAGFADLVPAIAQNYAVSTKASIDSATSQQAQQDAIQKSSQFAKGVLSELVSAAPKEQQDAVLRNGIDHLVNIYGPNSSTVKDILASTSSAKSVGDWVKEARGQSFTPLEHENLAVSQKNAETSAKSVAISSLNENMTAGENLVASTKSQNLSGLFEKGALATKQLPGFDDVSSKFGNFTQAKKQEFLSNNPQYAATQRLIDEYNIQNPGANLSITQGSAAVYDALHSEAIKQNNEAIAHANIAKLGGVNNVLPKTTESGIQGAQPISPTPTRPGIPVKDGTNAPEAYYQPIKMKSPKGDVILVPQDKVGEARLKGATVIWPQ